MTIRVFALYRHETVALGREHWRELDRLCRDADPDTQAALDRLLTRHGRVVSRRTVRNLVPTVGLAFVCASTFGTGSSFYVGIKGTGAPAAGDTMASHAGWSELVGYTQTTRPAFTTGTISTATAGNTASPALFTANASLTIAGAFLVSNNSKGGTTGTLLSVTNFTSGNRAVASGQTERVTASVTFA